jgi:hypothetical protein
MIPPSELFLLPGHPELLDEWAAKFSTAYIYIDSSNIAKAGMTFVGHIANQYSSFTL